MASDPYGFPASAPSGGTAPTGTNDGGALSQVLWLGVGSSMCAAIGPCLCYLPFVAAIPMGVLAVLRARPYRQTGSELERSVATVAMASGATGAGLGVLAVLAFLAYMIFFAFAAMAGGDILSDM